MVRNQPAKVMVLAWDVAGGVPKTGDADNITGYISIDGGEFQTLQNSTPTELSATHAPGLYYFDLTAAETNGNVLVVSAQSTTPEVRIRPVVAYPTELPPQVSAIKEKTDNLPSDTAQELSDIETGVNILTARLSETRAGYLDNLSGGSVALEATAQSIKAKTDTITNEFNEVDDSLSTLLGRLTEVRAGYLDNLSGGNVALEATVQAVKAKTDNLPNDPASQAAIEAAIAALNDITVGDIINGITDGTLNLQDMLRIMLAALAGKASGGGTSTIRFRDPADSKDRIVATVDTNGNRISVVLDPS